MVTRIIKTDKSQILREQTAHSCQPIEGFNDPGKVEIEYIQLHSELLETPVYKFLPLYPVMNEYRKKVLWKNVVSRVTSGTLLACGKGLLCQFSFLYFTYVSKLFMIIRSLLLKYNWEIKYNNSKRLRPKFEIRKANLIQKSFNADLKY